MPKQLLTIADRNNEEKRDPEATSLTLALR